MRAYKDTQVNYVFLEGEYFFFITTKLINLINKPQQKLNDNNNFGKRAITFGLLYR